MTKAVRNVYQSLGRYRALYLLSALELVVIISWSLYLNGKGNPDTASYYEAYDVLMSGRIDELRTPLYPLLAGSVRSIFGSGLSKAIVYIIQGIVFLFSINWFGKTLDNITSHKRVAYWFTAVYALYPGMLTACSTVMTESLSLSLMTAAIYLVSESYRLNSYKKAVCSGMACLLLWLLRPSLMPVTFIMLVFWGCLWVFKGKYMRKTAVFGFCVTLASLAGIGIYSMAFYNEYHKAGMSCVSTWNNYHLIRQAGTFDTDLVESPEIKAKIDSIIELNKEESDFLVRRWHELPQLHKELGLYEFDKFVNQQIRQHPGEIISYLYHERLDALLEDDCVATGNQGGLPFSLSSLTRVIRVNTGTAFLIFLTGLSVLLYTDIKRRRISYFVWLLYSLFAANYFTIWVGAPDAFTRLAVPNYPVLVAISCWLLDKLVSFAADEGKE